MKDQFYVPPLQILSQAHGCILYFLAVVDVLLMLWWKILKRKNILIFSQYFVEWMFFKFQPLVFQDKPTLFFNVFKCLLMQFEMFYRNQCNLKYHKIYSLKNKCQENLKIVQVNLLRHEIMDTYLKLIKVNQVKP